MRDLTSRLREIVRQNPPAAAAPVRELTYVPDVDGGDVPPETAAQALGGTVLETSGACVVVDRVWDENHWHGHRRVGAMTPVADAPLGLLEPRCRAAADWARHVVFFDIETTGLSGGAGTLAFLAGCGWFEGEGFRVRQFFLSGPSGERAMLDALTGIFERTSLLVTYNGRTFDVPTMDTRWAFHRTASPTGGLAHFDMLPPARRLWGGRGPDANCSLTSLERSLLGFHRIGDVAGFEIPTRYFHFLRSGDAAVIEGVLEHNRLDLISLAAVTAHALEIAHVGPDACRDEREQLGLGRIYERAEDLDRAARAFRLAAGARERDLRSAALGRLAELCRRTGRHDDAADAWRRLLEPVDVSGWTLSRYERRAAEGLAIHFEHRVKDPIAARRYAELLRRDAAGRLRAEAEHRLGRLHRKAAQAEDTKGGPAAARLSFDSDM
jgi:hypothetical protein